MLGLCLILVTVTYGIRFSFGVFFQPLEQDFEWTRTVTSTVFSVYMLLGSVFAVLGGWIADRYGPRVVFLVMGFLAALGLGLSSRAGSFWQLLLSYSLLVSAGNGATYPLASSIASRWFKERRTLALAISTSGVGLGSFLFPPFASWTIADHGWRTSFLILAALSLVVTTFCSLLLRRHPSERAIPSERGETRRGDSTSAEKTGEISGDFSLRQAMKTRSFALMTAILFFYAFCMFMVTTHVVRHAIDLGIDPLQAAAVMSVMGIASIPSRIGAGILADRFGRKRVAIACAGLMAASMLWLTLSSGAFSLYVFAAAFGAAYSGLGPTTNAIVGDTFGVRHLGSIMGVLEVAWVSGASVGPALAGYVFDATGSYYFAFSLAVVASLMIVILILMVKTPRAKGDSESVVRTLG
jgi:MFS family permease